MDRRIKQGKTLQKVRTLKERAAAQDATRAEQELDARTLEHAARKRELVALDQDVRTRAEKGMSMAQFMRYQHLREIHEDAVEKAHVETRQASHQLSECKGELRTAVTHRRAADKWLDASVERWRLEQKRNQQKTTDDQNCLRAGIRG
jgi:flagellar biosynthesis chaperone FliJ